METVDTKVRSILISQPEPQTENSPYFDLIEKYKVNLEFRPFIKVESVDLKEYRKERVRINEHTAVIFTSLTSIDNFFRICKETRINLPEEMKFFCVTESIAFYLQKFIVYRKRKVFYPKTRDKSIYDMILKHKTDKFIFPRSNFCNNEMPDFLKKNKIKFTSTILYKTISNDLSDVIDLKDFDILAFFSPAGIKSLFENFPKFKQNGIRIAAFGPSTCKAVEDAKLRLDIKAPTPQSPSMKMALENYIKKVNK